MTSAAVPAKSLGTIEPFVSAYNSSSVSSITSNQSGSSITVGLTNDRLASLHSPRRRGARNVGDQRRQKLFLDHAHAGKTRPFGPGRTVSPTFYFCVHRDVRTITVDRLNLDRYGIASARPATRSGGRDISVAT